MIRRILVPLDGSGLAESALPHAAAVARTFGSELLVLRVAHGSEGGEFSRMGDPLVGAGRPGAVTYVDGVLKRLWEAGHQAVGEVVEGAPATAILHFAWKRNADLVVLATHGEGGLSPFPLSGTAFKVALRADCAVYLVPPGAPERNVRRTSEIYRTILVPLDCSPRAEVAAGLGAALAEEHRAGLLLAHVALVPRIPRRSRPAPEDERLAAELLGRNRAEAESQLQELAARLGPSDLEVETQVIEAATPAPAIRRLARDRNADLLILTAHGQSGSSDWAYGGIAGKLLLQNGCPMLIHQDAPVRPLAGLSGGPSRFAIRPPRIH